MKPYIIFTFFSFTLNISAEQLWHRWPLFFHAYDSNSLREEKLEGFVAGILAIKNAGAIEQKAECKLSFAFFTERLSAKTLYESLIKKVEEHNNEPIECFITPIQDESEEYRLSFRNSALLKVLERFPTVTDISIKNSESPDHDYDIPLGTIHRGIKYETRADYYRHYLSGDIVNKGTFFKLGNYYLKATSFYRSSTTLIQGPLNRN